MIRNLQIIKNYKKNLKVLNFLEKYIKYYKNYKIIKTNE